MAAFAFGQAPDPPRRFEWLAGFARARQAQAASGRPILLYFPPVGGRGDPAHIVSLPARIGALPPVEGARVSAAEVLELSDRYRVKKLPALVLVDRAGNSVAGWQGGIPGDLLRRVQAAVEKLDDADAREARLVLEAEQAAGSGDLSGAYRKVEAVLARGSAAAADSLARARAVEARHVAELWSRALRILAGEGVQPDAEVVAGLESIGSSAAHAGFEAALAVEMARLKASSPGGR